MRKVNVGDKFKLGPWEWIVKTVGSRGFSATHDEDYNPSQSDWEGFRHKDADQLDWIKPEPTFTKEQVEAIMQQMKGDREFGLQSSHEILLKRWLDSHTEKQD